MTRNNIIKPDLRYRYEFSVHELEKADQCLDEHGFCVIEDLLPTYMVEELKVAIYQAADPNNTLAHGESFTHAAFIETNPKVWKLLDYGPFMSVQAALLGTEQLTINRSACILRKQGSPPVSWHTDWRGFDETTPIDPGGILNRGDWPSGTWFYLTGSRPEHGGLCVIEDSHLPDWNGPAGFALTADRKSFFRIGTNESAYNDFDIPGLVPFFTKPGDMIVFADRTYHGAFSNTIAEDRLSFSIGFRRTDQHIEPPWPLPESSRLFIEKLPQHLRRYTEGYTGIERNWRKT